MPLLKGGIPRVGLRVLLVALALLASVAIIAWIALPLIQAARAGSMLEDANNHIESANGSLAELQLDILALEGFTSLEGISAAQQSLSGADELIESSKTDVEQAEEQAATAAGLKLLPGWYSEYLGKKREITELRFQQLQILDEASSQLDELYRVAPLIFQSMQEMDRLLGQLEAAITRTQDEPQTASVELEQVSSSMRAIQKQLDDKHGETGFDLLERMSRNVADNAALAEAAGLLADAVASGDQAQAQQAAASLEQQLMDTSVGVDYLDIWFRTEMRPLKRDYNELQERQARLDGEATALYEENSGG